MIITIDKEWNDNDGSREGRNGRTYTTGGRLRWYVVVDGQIESDHDLKRQAVAHAADLQAQDTMTKQTRTTTTKPTAAARMGRPTLGTAKRQAILIKVDPAVIAFFREQADAQGIGYQTLMHKVLAGAASMFSNQKEQQ